MTASPAKPMDYRVSARHIARCRGRRPPFLFVNMTANLPENFQEIVAIDDIDYLSQAVALTALFNDAIDTVSGRFDQGKARTLIANYNAALPITDKRYQIGIFNVYQSTLSQTNALVSGMISRIVEVLKQAVGVALGTATVEQMTGAITDAFTDLETQSGDAWIFWEKKTGNKTTYSYAILFAIQDASTGKMMFALPMSMEIEVNQEYERVLFITVSDRETYSVKLDAMKVGQILFPKSPGSNSLRNALAAQTGATPDDSSDDGPMVDLTPVTNVIVSNWARSTTFATAAKGQYSKDGTLVQLWAEAPDIQNAVYEENRYVLCYQRNGRQETMPMILNSILPDEGALWFVSQ